MTKINLLSKLGKSKREGSKSLFSFLGSKGGSPSKEGKNSSSAHKIRPPSTKFKAALFFILPIVACVSLESLLEDEMKKALEQITDKLSVEEKKFQTEWREAPPIEEWEKAHQKITLTKQILSRYQAIDIQLTREYIQQMTDAVPQEAWIKRFSFKHLPQESKQQVEIEGYAFTSETVLLFLSKLKNKPLFRNVHLKFSEPTMENGIQEHRFFMHSNFRAQLFDSNDFNASAWGYNNY